MKLEIRRSSFRTIVQLLVNSEYMLSIHQFVEQSQCAKHANRSFNCSLFSVRYTQGLL